VSRAVDLERPLMEIAERLTSDVPVASRLELTSATRRPVVPEHRPGSALLRLEVDLDELPRRVPAHHDVKEHFTGRHLEQVDVVDERDIDAAGVFRISVHDLVGARRQWRCESRNEQIEHEPVLDFADPEQVGTGAVIHLGDDRCKPGHLSIPAGRCPTSEVGADGALELLRPAGRILLIEEVLKVPSRNVVRRWHLHIQPGPARCRARPAC
jgi:hypothetical protein